MSTTVPVTDPAGHTRHLADLADQIRHATRTSTTVSVIYTPDPPGPAGSRTRSKITAVDPLALLHPDRVVYHGQRDPTGGLAGLAVTMPGESGQVPVPLAPSVVQQLRDAETMAQRCCPVWWDGVSLDDLHDQVRTVAQLHGWVEQPARLALGPRTVGHLVFTRPGQPSLRLVIILPPANTTTQQRVPVPDQAKLASPPEPVHTDPLIHTADRVRVGGFDGTYAQTIAGQDLLLERTLPLGQLYAWANTHNASVTLDYRLSHDTSLPAIADHWVVNGWVVSQFADRMVCTSDAHIGGLVITTSQPETLARLRSALRKILPGPDPDQVHTGPIVQYMAGQAGPCLFASIDWTSQLLTKGARWATKAKWLDRYARAIAWHEHATHQPTSPQPLATILTRALAPTDPTRPGGTCVATTATVLPDTWQEVIRTHYQPQPPTKPT